MLESQTHGSISVLIEREPEQYKLGGKTGDLMHAAPQHVKQAPHPTKARPSSHQHLLHIHKQSVLLTYARRMVNNTDRESHLEREPGG